MKDVGLLVNLKELDRAIAGDSAESAKPVDLSGRDRGNLRLVHIKRRKSRRDRTFAALLLLDAHQLSRRRNRRGTENPLARDSQSLGKAQPQLGMILRAALFLNQILQKRLPGLDIGAS